MRPVALVTTLALVAVALPAQAHGASAYLLDFKVVSPAEDGAHLRAFANTGPYGAVFVDMEAVPETSGCVNGGSLVYTGGFMPAELPGGQGDRKIVWPHVEGKDRLCLYLDEYTDQIHHSGRLLAAENVFRRPVAPQPPSGVPNPEPLPAPGLSKARAAKAARSALADRFGRKWTRGSRRSLRCVEVEDTERSCKVSWRYSKFRYAGKVRVWITSAGLLRTSVKVTRRAVPSP